MRCSSGEALFGQLLLCGVDFLEVAELHAGQDAIGFRELDVLVSDDLNAIAPRVPEIKETVRHDIYTHLFDAPLDKRLVRDYQAEMTVRVPRLLVDFRQSEELIAHIDKRHGLALATQFEVEERAVKGERLFNVTNFERDVIDTHHRCCVGL